MGTLVLKNLSKSFNDTNACKEISLSIKKGEFFTFLGPSGCGKTTILRLISGFLKPEKGSILLGSVDITHMEAEKRQIGMVFQNYALFPFMTVYENIEYGLKIQKTPKPVMRDKVSKFIHMVGLTGFEKRNISELSGGEQQRVALARSLVTKPSVLLLDEPLSNLDAILRDKMRVEIKSLQKKLGITTIFVTHDQTEALTLSDRIAVFDQGKNVQTGTPDEIYSNPNCAFVASFIGDTNLFETRISKGEAVISKDISLKLNTHAPKGRYLSIRPQEMKISAVDPGGPNTFKCILDETQLNGAWIEYFVRIKETSFRVVDLNTKENRLKAMPSAHLYVSIPPENIKILES